MKNESEFGKGRAYCLGLFLAHAERDFFQGGKVPDGMRPELQYEMWFYAASDHLFEFEAKTEREVYFQAKCLGLRLPMNAENGAKKHDVLWAISEAKALLLLIDKENGIDAIKGENE